MTRHTSVQGGGGGGGEEKGSEEGTGCDTRTVTVRSDELRRATHTHTHAHTKPKMLQYASKLNILKKKGLQKFELSGQVLD